MVIPARSYVELMRILGDTEEPADIILAPAKSQVIFRVETTEVVSRLIDGQFPNYQSVLPTSHSTRALVDRDDLLKAVRLSALIASSAANVVRLGFGGEEDPSAVSVAAAADIGDAEGRVEIQLEGDPVTIAFNARYLVEALQNLRGRAARRRAQRPPVTRCAEARGRPCLRARHHAGAYAVLRGRPYPGRLPACPERPSCKRPVGCPSRRSR